MVGLVPVRGIVELRLPPPFREGQHRRDRRGHQQATADPVANGGLDEQDDEELVYRRADLVLVDENEGRDDGCVDCEAEEADPQSLRR